MNFVISSYDPKQSFKASILVVFVLFPFVSFAAPVRYLPTPYLQQSDSPFIVANGGAFTIGANNYFLDDFEDSALNVPGVVENSGNPIQFLSGPPYTDSVDEDDGIVDGNGINGTSLIAWYHPPTSEPSLVFSFDSNVLGSLPTHAGFVITGLNLDSTMEVSAFDESHNLIDYFQFDLRVEGNGGVEEDRFVGISDLSGIARLELSHITNLGDQVEIDHLQYGIVPIPAAIWLFGIGLLGLRGLTIYWKFKQDA